MMNVQSPSPTQLLSFDAQHETELIARDPKLVVTPGERFVVEARDALGGVITDEDQPPTEAVFGERLARDEFNACAGPIAVAGAEPGDVLVVSIHEIVPAERGVTCVFEGAGPLGDSATYPDCRGPFTKVIDHAPGASGTTADGIGSYAGRSWRLHPHIGTIATAPLRPLSAGADANYGQGPFGGNLDCRHMCAGNDVWLPVAHDGGCLYLGDAHACMADGELYGVADEVAARVTLSCRVVKQRSVPFVRIQTPEAIVQLNSSRPLDDAVDGAFRWMLDWLVEDHGLTARDAYVLLGVHPDVRIEVYQFVKLGRLNYTVGVSFPISALPG